MDAVPVEQLRALDKQLGAVFAQFVNKRKKKKKNSLTAELSNLMQIRNRFVVRVEVCYIEQHFAI